MGDDIFGEILPQDRFHELYAQVGSKTVAIYFGTKEELEHIRDDHG